ncbi:hypothetical protein [Palaeococcus ferrophilus]|uniref:hypothetical protein n=1 Tax=Palaeococcus ferrophilus TaxID=83868 RepID=UPI00064FC472|nr:hypothetical protein [Palaeococcus ferrophilus]
MKAKILPPEEGKEETQNAYPIDLNRGIDAVRNLWLSPPDAEIPEMIGFVGGRAFIKFTRLPNGYQVRYESPEEDRYPIGELTEEEAVECLEDFFEGRSPRWENKLGEY